MKIIEKRYWYFLLSLLVMLPGLTGLAVWGLPLAIALRSLRPPELSQGNLRDRVPSA